MDTAKSADASEPVARGEGEPRGHWPAGLASARLDRHEVAGAFGDLGTFLPLLVAMSVENRLDFAAGLFFAGLFNVVTGCVFAIPMAVQPMKAIAAIAITRGLTVPEIVVAGALVSAVILVLGLTGLIEAVDRLVPRSTVRGIQLAVGLSLLIKGVTLAITAKEWLALDGRLTAATAALVVLVLARSRTVPAALILVAAGIAMVAVARPAEWGAVSWTLWFPHPSLLHWSIDAGVLRAALPQVPLTTLNSVVAVCALSRDLFPQRPAGTRTVSVSVGLMNLLGAPFGAMPMCHGAGGLAGQYRFGARTSGSILFLGALKIALAVFLGGSMMGICRSFPSSILGVMLAFSGAELALVARDQTRRDDALVVVSTAGVALALNDVATGFVAGLVVALVLRFGNKGRNSD
jgi:MFS superfamily sulfate permease-like transporter